MLKFILGNFFVIIFVFVLLFFGIFLSIIAVFIGGIIMVGFYRRFYNIEELLIKIGIIILLVLVFIIIFFIFDLFKVLIIL